VRRKQADVTRLSPVSQAGGVHSAAVGEIGLIKPGGTVVEGTAGNTGIGLAHVCRAKGYKCVIYMPNTQSQEKIDLLRMLGADVRPVPAVAFTDPANYNHQAAAYSKTLSNAVWCVSGLLRTTGNCSASCTRRLPAQRAYGFIGPTSLTTRRIAMLTTQPQAPRSGRSCRAAWTASRAPLVRDPHLSPRKSDGLTPHSLLWSFSGCVSFDSGTGGTLAGTARYLKEQRKNVKIFVADPPGSVLYRYFKSGGKELERTGTGSITEGRSVWPRCAG